jgi:hypothetical protein
MAVENTRRLRAVGPIDPDHGFPLWFEDETGLRLELGLHPDPLTPAIGDLPKPAEPLSFPDNFPDESFYFLAEAELQVGGNGVTGRARVILALEAAFGGDGSPKEELNVVFARIRVRMDNLIPGESYKVTHPYGVIDDPELLKADERGRVFYTEDLGIIEGDPTAVLNRGKVAPFLKGLSAAPNGYIGDGVTEQRITGSPFNTNFVMIEGSQISDGGGDPDPSDPANPDRVWTDLFSVQGKLAKRVGAWVEGAAYARVSGGFLLNVQARSDAGQDLRFVVPSAVGSSGVHLKLVGEGEFYTGLAQVTSLPTNGEPVGELVNISDSPPTRYPIKFKDLVIVESAVHDRTTGTLTIKARSSDSGAVLTIPQLGLTLTANPQSFPRIAAPAELIVQSNLGGKGRQPVEVQGGVDGNQPVEAIVVPIPEVFTKELITLDGSGSLGATVFAWTQTSGPIVVLTDANSAKATFTATATGTYTFKLTVQGDGGPKDASVTLLVTDPGPDNLTVDQREYRTSKRQFRFSGNVTPARVSHEVVVIFKGEELGRGTTDVNGDWSARKTLLQSELNLDPTNDNPIQPVQIQSKRSRSTEVSTIQQSLTIRN